MALAFFGPAYSGPCSSDVLFHWAFGPLLEHGNLGDVQETGVRGYATCGMANDTGFSRNPLVEFCER
jgi:hypothetical protein